MASPLDAEIKVRLSKETKERLEHLAMSEEDGAKISDVVRRAIRFYLNAIEDTNARVGEEPGPKTVYLHTGSKKRQPKRQAG
jgi:Arc/MetJ-type ribon-helix-helix transcriptional regulator